MTAPCLPAPDLDAVSSRVPWDELRGARVAITGGTGFYGRWLVETLLHANARFGLGARVVIVARRPDRARSLVPRLADSAVELVRGDVRDRLDLGSPTHVIHAAASASAALYETNPHEMISTIVDGTRRVLEASRGAARFLFTSSGAVYGRLPPEVSHVSEDHLGGPDPLSPRATYAEAKRLAELLCAIEVERGRVPAVISRGFAFVGPGLPLDRHFAIGNFLADALAGRPIVVRGDGTPVRSYLYAADLATWTWVMLLRGRPGRAYNVGSEQALSIAELARTIGRLFGRPSEILGSPRPGHAPERYVPSTRRAHEELQLTPTVDLEDALLRTARWNREAGET